MRGDHPPPAFFANETLTAYARPRRIGALNAPQAPGAHATVTILLYGKGSAQGPDRGDQ
jgi:hypothetical protein